MARSIRTFAFLVLTAALVACSGSTDGGSGPDCNGGGGRDTGGRGDTGTMTDTGPTDTGGMMDTATDTPVPDTGGPDTPTPDTGGPDTPTPDTGGPDTPPGDTGELCGEAYAEAEQRVLPVDIVWLIDNSSSMLDQISEIEGNINAFAEFIGETGLDYRVIMLSNQVDERVLGMISYYGVCVPAPLNCAGTCEPEGPIICDDFVHIPRTIDSTDALRAFNSSYPAVRRYLREDAILHVAVVTDDESDTSLSEWESQLTALDPPLALDNIVFHSIVGNGQSCQELPGTIYQGISNRTGGVIESSCASNWDPVFDAIAENVLEGTVLPCNYPIPEFEDNTVRVNPDQVNVYFTDEGGMRQVLTNVDDLDNCGSNQSWYFDDIDDPTEVILCPSACGQVDGEVELEFGCRTIKE